ncbi:hypothetical protein Tco_0364443 [Tanacetum coccineum]
MEISIADHIALDDALVAPADRLKIGKCNLRLARMSHQGSRATLHVVYDVLTLNSLSQGIPNQTINKKHILGLDQFRDILQICPKIGNKKFEEPPFEKEILAFLASLGHSKEIRKITDVNLKSLLGYVNKKNVDYAYLLWEDFIYQIENKNTKKGNAMYYPRFTKLVVNFVMEKDPSIPRRNKINLDIMQR